MAATATDSPSSSSSAATPSSNRNPNPNSSSNSSNTMQSWWESISRARSRILSLSSLLSLPSLSSLADSDRPAASLLDSADSYSAVSAAISLPSSGSGNDALCQWLYETFQSSDPDLRIVVLSFIPLLAGLYLSRVISSSYSALAGFESVILTIYLSETRSRGGKPLLISIPDLSQPSLYHSPSPNPRSPSPTPQQERRPKVGILSPPLEPQTAVKSTKRACIVAVALDCYYKKISLMPVKSKIDFCQFVVSWAGQDCPCRYELDDESNSSPLSNFEEEDREIGSFSEELGRWGISERLNGNCNGDSRGCGDPRGCRVPLPWELMQPVLRILGHCLLAPKNAQEVRDAASAAVRSLYARASHDLVSQAILASRSLIQLDKGARKAARDMEGMAVAGGRASNPATPSKPKKPEMLLVSK